MKITKTQLKQIIKEEINKTLNEGIRDYLLSDKIHSSIPAGSLARVLSQNPDLSAAATNPANPEGQQQAFAKIGKLLAQEKAIKRAIGDEDIERHLNVKGLLRYAEENMPQIFRR